MYNVYAILLLLLKEKSLKICSVNASLLCYCSILEINFKICIASSSQNCWNLGWSCLFNCHYIYLDVSITEYIHSCLKNILFLPVSNSDFIFLCSCGPFWTSHDVNLIFIIIVATIIIIMTLIMIIIQNCTWSLWNWWVS